MERKLNLAKLKSKVAQLKGDKSSQTKRTSVFWTPQLPKGETSKEYTIFLMPWPDLEDYPFKERWFYYSLGNMKDENGNSLKNDKGHYISAPLTLRQFGETDPVDELIQKLWSDEGKEEDEAKQDREDAKALFAALTTYIPVIVKGEESLGVRLWKFSSKVVYERLIELFMKEKIGVLNDVKNDVWLTVKVVEEPKKKFPMNKKIGSVDLELIDREPLSKDPEEIAKWVANVPDLDEALKYQRYDADGLKKLLLMWADSGVSKVDDDDDGKEGASSDDDSSKEKKKGSRSSKKKEPEEVEEKEKKTKEQMLKELDEDFGDDDDDDDEE